MTTNTKDWAPEAEAAINLCKQWATEVSSAIPCSIYLFGSVIYEEGDQFDEMLSDLDIVVVFSEDLDVTGRVDRLKKLKKFKFSLELQLISTFHRTNCVEPGVSVVPISKFELEANVHKSGVRRFFDRNIFLDLASEEQSVGLPSVTVGTLSDENRQAVEYAQKVRNEFLAISANNTGGITPFDGSDPLPKALARAAAQLVPDAEVGAWYDTRLGLEHLWAELARRQGESEALRALYRKMSVRRGGRGRRQSLTAEDQLLLVEVLHDLAAASGLEPVINWEIRFVGAPFVDRERVRIAAELRRLVPDAQVYSVLEGSIVFRLRSSKRSFETIQTLRKLSILPQFFGVEAVEVSQPDSSLGFVSFATKGPIEQLVLRILAWRPLSSDNERTSEEKLGDWLEVWLREESKLSSYFLLRDTLIDDGARPLRADYVLDFVANGRTERLVIELARLRRRSGFFRMLDRMLQFSSPSILVLTGENQLFDELRADIDRVAQLNSQLRIVTVPLDNG